MSGMSDLAVKRHTSLGRDKGLSGAYTLKTVPTKADMRRAFTAMDAKLTRAERQIDAVLERQTRK